MLNHSLSLVRVIGSKLLTHERHGSPRVTRDMNSVSIAYQIKVHDATTFDYAKNIWRLGVQAAS